MVKQVLRTGQHEEIEPLLIKIKKIVKKHLKSDKYKIYLYGSWANGTALNVSDIDIAVDAGKKLESTVIIKIKDDIENLPTLRSIDFIDLLNVSDVLKAEVLEKGIYLK